VVNELNWQMSSVLAVLFFVLGAWALQATYPALPRPAVSRWRLTRLLLWLFSAPYLAVAVAEGIWFEAMRLLMPVLLCDHVLRRAVADGAPAELALGDEGVAIDPEVLEAQRDA
jgi:hypothetical protein